jgi:homoserine dehydrogenase
MPPRIPTATLPRGEEGPGRDAPAPPSSRGTGGSTDVRMRSASRSVRVGLLGFGTVGSGVLAVLGRNRDDIERKVGRGIEVARILVRDLAKPRAVAAPRELLTTDADDILGDSTIGVVVEVMGGTRDALAHMLRALRAGKSVVTANKDVMAEYGREIWAAAAAGGADVYFEASVGGGIPIIRAL